MIRTILATRSAHWALAALLCAAGLSALIGTHVLRVELAPARPEKLPLAELCAIMAATMLAIITRPRLWEWDRAANSHRARTVAATVAATGIAFPAACVLAVVPELPDGTPWNWVLANVLALSAALWLMAPFLGPLWSGLTTLLLWLLCGVLHNVQPELTPYLPTSSYADAEGHWLFVAVLAAAALLVQVRTLGTIAGRRGREDRI